MIREHSPVVLTEARPALGLEAGDIGTVVHCHQGGEAYEVEFAALDGRTLAIETLTARQIRSASAEDMPHVRGRPAA